VSYYLKGVRSILGACTFSAGETARIKFLILFIGSFTGLLDVS